MSLTTPIRVIFQQPTLAEYRIAFYRELAKSGDLKVKVVHSESPKILNCEPDGFEAQLLKDRSFLGDRFIWHSAQTRMANRKSCDVLVFSCSLRYASLLPGMLLARKNRVGVVLWGHHFSTSNHKTGEFLRNKVLFRMADSIVCYSHDVANNIRRQKHLASKTFVAANAVDINPIQAARIHWQNSPALTEFKRAHGIEKGPNLLFVSRIQPNNRLAVLIEVLGRTRKRFPDARAIIIGGHNEEQKRIQSLAVDKGLGDAVLFPGAIYDQMKLAPWFLSSDLFFYPSQIGLSLFHAFGYGLPVIAGDHPILRNPEVEALRNGKNGFRFDEGDIDQATDRVFELITNPDLRDSLSRDAIRTVTDEFNIEIMASGFADAIKYAAARTMRDNR